MKFSDIIEKYPLYKRMNIDIDVHNVWSISGLTYKSFCKISKSTQTFELQIYPQRMLDYYSMQPAQTTYTLTPEGMKRNIHKVNVTQHYKGICKCCNDFSEDYIIEINSTDIEMENGKFQHQIKKIGQFPPFSIQPDSEVQKFFDPEELDFYQKALMNLSSNYGIGAYSYLRRIVEKLILKLCIKFSELDNPQAQDIKDALIKYQANHQMTTLIKEIYPLLPDSFKNLGENPLKLLHSELSIGIHSLTESECYDKAISIDTLLKFVIKKLNEEVKEVGEIRAAISNLRGSNR